MSKQIYLKVRDLLRCPKCFAEIDQSDAGDFLVCKNNPSHRFPIVEGIPIFVRRGEISPKDAKWVFEYNEKAEEFDKALEKYDEWLNVDLMDEFQKAWQKVPIESSQKVLDVSTGTGNVILGFRQSHPNISIEFVGVDLSFGLLRVAQRKFIQKRVEVPLFHSQIKKLPFKNESFEIVAHCGGINTFEDIPGALEEMIRVLKPNGALIIVDEGISPALRKTRRGEKIVNDNRLFGLLPPLQHLPPQAKNVELRWIARDTFYMILCQKLSKEELKDIKPLSYEIAIRLL